MLFDSGAGLQSCSLVRAEAAASPTSSAPGAVIVGATVAPNAAGSTELRISRSVSEIEGAAHGVADSSSCLQRRACMCACRSLEAPRQVGAQTALHAPSEVPASSRLGPANVLSRAAPRGLVELDSGPRAPSPGALQWPSPGIGAVRVRSRRALPIARADVVGAAPDGGREPERVAKPCGASASPRGSM